MSTSTRTHQHPRQSEPPPRSGDLSPATLAIAAAASAVAAFVTSKVWAAGTLWSAAMSPIIVALVKEGLNRPAKVIRTVRVTRGGRTTEVELPADAAGELERQAPAGQTPVTLHRSRSAGRRRWRLAIVTGLLAFAVVAVAYTVPELVAGKSIGAGGDQRTTLFGGSASKRSASGEDADKAKDKDARSKDDGAGKRAAPAAGTTPTPTPEATSTPGATPTPSATPSATATATPPPAAAPPGAQATPAPTP